MVSVDVDEQQQKRQQQQENNESTETRQSCRLALYRALTPQRSIPPQPHSELGIDLELQEPNQPQIHSDPPIRSPTPNPHQAPIHLELQIDPAPTRSLILRPFLHWVLPQTRKPRADIKIAKRLIEPELKARQEEARRAGKEFEKPIDALQRVQTAADAKGQHCDPVYGQLNYTLGAVHTTSVTFVNALYDLMVHPKYIDLLRVMKESSRLHPATMLPVNRVAEEIFSLSGNTVIPKGATLCVPTMRARDPTVYEELKKFDGHRLYNLSQQSGGATKYQSVSTSNDHIIFGNSKHASPGRFFASNEIKIIPVHLLTKYDLKFLVGKTDRPKAMKMSPDLLPDPNMNVLIRSRTNVGMKNA